MLVAAATEASSSAAVLQWLHESPPAMAMREGRWLYPLVEAGHIVGFVVLVGAAAMFDLRLLGFSRKTITVNHLSRHVLPWSMGALVVVVPTGLLLFASDAPATWQNPAFRIKMLLLAVAGLNAAIYQFGIKRGVLRWDIDVQTPLIARISAVLSLLLWSAIICCGRLIAYI